MRIQHLFDRRGRHPAVEARDHAAFLYEPERRHRFDAEAGGQVRPRVDVDLLHVELIPFFARDVREQALHAPGRPGALRGEEHEEGAVVLHVWTTEKPRSGVRQYTPVAMGAWYWIGVAAGLGAAAGVALVVVAVLAAAAGAGLGAAVDAWQPGSWGDVVAGAFGGFGSAFGSAQIVRGALRRGGTAVGT